jgi:hypothetical protein
MWLAGEAGGLVQHGARDATASRELTTARACLSSRPPVQAPAYYLPLFPDGAKEFLLVSARGGGFELLSPD